MEENKMHPLVSASQEALRSGKISRRDFLRISTLVGISLTTANFLAACAQATEAPAPTTAPAQPTTAPVVAATAMPTEAVKPAVVRGNSLADRAVPAHWVAVVVPGLLDSRQPQDGLQSQIQPAPSTAPRPVASNRGLDRTLV